MKMKKFYVNAGWCDIEKVWSVNDTNIPGLNIEASNCKEVLSVLRDVVPELLEANGTFDNE